MSCKYCKKDAIYRCNICERLICGQHAKLRTVCTSCIKKTTLNCTIDKVTLDKERKKIREIVQRSWGRGRATRGSAVRVKASLSSFSPICFL